MHAVTIAARNYLALAKALAKSFKAHNPQHDITILLVDAEPGEIAPSPDFHIATPHDLSLTAEEFGRMSLLYDVTELSTSLKPWALEMLLDGGADVAVYLDPDIFVYDRLDEIERLGLENGIVLTPHTTQPMPRDGLRPTEADIMGSGTFNLGFIAVGKSNRPMLQWWQQRLLRDSISAPAQMLFTDQRWIDLVPSYFSNVALRDPGYNVAYWNLDHRHLSAVQGKYFVNGQPLRFFHFSGYRPETPWILSKYVADKPRVVLSEQPVARELCEQYGSIIGDEGAALAVPYRFNRLRDGTRVTPPMRRIYRKAVIEAEEVGTAYPPAPSAADQDAAIRAWFTEPAHQPGSINRLVAGVWDSRPDLQAAFPDPFGSDAGRLLDWCLTSGIKDGQVVASLLPDRMAPVPALRPVLEDFDTCGVNLAGYFQAEMGVGQIGRLMVEAVKATGLPFSTLRSTATLSRQQAHFDDAGDHTRYSINIVSVNADQFGPWARSVGSDILDNRYTIGVWAWEVEEFPDVDCHAFNLVHEVWAISSFVRDALAAKTDKPVYVIPYQIAETPPVEPLDRAALGLPDGPYFFFMFDYFSVFERKNPLGLIEAFIAAFPHEGEAALVIKTMNGNRFRSQQERLRYAARERADIHIIDSYLDRSVVASLSAHAVAYVSLHRAEGLGLTMSESMAAGRPVIATGYSGNLDFMSPADSLLIPYKLVNIPASAQPYPTTCRWAEPDLDAAAEAMRWVIAHPVDADALGERARQHVRATGNLARTVDFITGRVNDIYPRLPRPATITPPRARPVLPPAAGPAAIEPEPPSAGPAAIEPEPLSTGPAAIEPEPLSAGPLSRATVMSERIARVRCLLDTPPDVNSPSRLPVLVKRVRQVAYRGLAHRDEHVNERLYAVAAALEATEAVTHQVASQLDERIDSVSAQVQAQVQAERGSVERVKTAHARIDSVNSQLGGVNDLIEQARTGLDAQTARIDTLSDALDDQRLALQIEAERLETLATSQPLVEAVVRSHGAQFYDVAARLNELSSSLTRLDTEQAAEPYRSDPAALRITDEGGHLLMGYDEGQGAVGADYASFEDVYRGSEEFISARMSSYVDLLDGRDPVLDIGCGRGEFLTLLHQAGITAVGVDLDESMVRRSKERDLDVHLVDAVSFLRAAPTNSFGAITSFQVVEHLPPAEIKQLFTASFDALKPGGVLIAETVNPHSPAALKTFWLDVTHVRPLFPESLLFMARECGFTVSKVIFPNLAGELSTQLRYSGEYAVLAYKPEHA